MIPFKFYPEIDKMIKEEGIGHKDLPMMIDYVGYFYKHLNPSKVYTPGTDLSYEHNKKVGVIKDELAKRGCAYPAGNRDGKIKDVMFIHVENMYDIVRHSGKHYFGIMIKITDLIGKVDIKDIAKIPEIDRSTFFENNRMYFEDQFLDSDNVEMIIEKNMALHETVFEKIFDGVKELKMNMIASSEQRIKKIMQKVSILANYYYYKKSTEYIAPKANTFGIYEIYEPINDVNFTSKIIDYLMIPIDKFYELMDLYAVAIDDENVYEYHYYADPGDCVPQRYTPKNDKWFGLGEMELSVDNDIAQKFTQSNSYHIVNYKKSRTSVKGTSKANGSRDSKGFILYLSNGSYISTVLGYNTPFQLLHNNLIDDHN